MVVDALDADVLPVDEQALLGVEANAADAEAGLVAVPTWPPWRTQVTPR